MLRVPVQGVRSFQWVRAAHLWRSIRRPMEPLVVKSDRQPALLARRGLPEALPVLAEQEHCLKIRALLRGLHAAVA